MSERTDEGEGPPTDAPDWFDAGAAEDADPTDAGGSGRSPDPEEGWFDDPDHRPIEADTERGDAADAADAGTHPTEEAARGKADGPTAEEGTESTAGEEGESTTREEGGRTDEGGPEPPGEAEDRDGTAAGEPPGTATATEGPLEATTASEERAGSAVAAAGTDDSRTVPGEGERGSVPDEGEATEESSAAAPADEPGADDGDDARSPLRRLLAWLRSIPGRLG